MLFVVAGTKPHLGDSEVDASGHEGDDVVLSQLLANALAAEQKRGPGRVDVIGTRTGGG